MLNLWLIGFCSFLLVNAAFGHDIQHIFLTDQNNQGIESNGNLAWPWSKNKDTFTCPSPFGAFPDEEDCQHFFVCFASIFSRKKCPPMYQFDKYRRMCLPFLVAVCEKGQSTVEVPVTEKDASSTTQKGESTVGVLTTERYVISTTRKEKFSCPRMVGLFPHPTDCKMYYSCTFFMHTLKTCQNSDLFDAEKKKCLPAAEVNCFTRSTGPSTVEVPTTEEAISSTMQKGKFSCPAISGLFPHPTDCKLYYSCNAFKHTLKTCLNSELFDAEQKKCLPEEEVNCFAKPTDATTESMISTTSEDITLATESDEPITAESTIDPETTLSPTTPTVVPEEHSTTPKTRPTAPETTCKEDDVECIIDDLGETPDWFTCPEDVGGHPHPSSRKLFIFCLNWKPSVKRCGQDLIFSEELSTCVSP